MIGKLNLEQKTSAFSKFGCKNEGFVTAMVQRKTQLHRVGFELKEDHALFDNGKCARLFHHTACHLT